MFISCVFSWKLPLARERAIQVKKEGYYVRCGGTAVILNPSYLSDVADISGSVPALYHHNKDATFTTRGCIRNCSFCAVPRYEGKFRELSGEEWQPKPIVCDNNFLASSDQHFNHVIDRLLEANVKKVDFNQGLDARLLTLERAKRINELDIICFRLAWDDIRLENLFMRAFNIAIEAGISAKKIRAYVLVGYKDTPEDALYRCEKIKFLGALPNPMRYQPLDTPKRNSYIGENWTDRQLKDFCRYWARQNWLGGVKFEDYRSDYKKKTAMV